MNVMSSAAGDGSSERKTQETDNEEHSKLREHSRARKDYGGEREKNRLGAFGRRWVHRHPLVCFPTIETIHIFICCAKTSGYLHICIKL